VLILGARQVGKTTLARHALPNAHYCDLQSPSQRELFSLDPKFQVESRSDRALILDEAQVVPPSIRSASGNNRRQPKPEWPFPSAWIRQSLSDTRDLGITGRTGRDPRPGPSYAAGSADRTPSDRPDPSLDEGGISGCPERRFPHMVGILPAHVRGA
ncbi:MAG: hypothetical protein FJW35_12955, partial [Acidobacteria bacterium]|nr:hypothetical protein [Acidobacteriota bacterium]